MNLFELFCRNSHYLEHRTTKAEKISKFKELGKAFNKQYFAFVDSLVPSLMCPLEIIENFTGEKYNFEKHIKPLVDEGLFWIRKAGEYDKSIKGNYESWGLCMDYKTKIKYLQFYLGNIDPNKDRTFNDVWI